jgi:hypothetical protein
VLGRFSLPFKNTVNKNSICNYYWHSDKSDDAHQFQRLQARGTVINCYIQTLIITRFNQIGKMNRRYKQKTIPKKERNRFYV